MAVNPNAQQYLPLSGGTLTGAISTQGITNTVAAITSDHPITTSGLQAISASGALNAVAGNVDVQSAGTGLRVSEGANGKQGRTAAMTAGTITVANTSTTAASEILLTGQTLGGTAGGCNISARTAGTSFTITSTNAADTSTVGFEMFEPG